MQQAKSADPGGISMKYLKSAWPSDYMPNINAFIGQKCGIIVTVGFLMGTATQSAAKAHPNPKIAIVDSTTRPAEERRRADVQHRGGWLPGRLPGGRDDQDREGGHVRRQEVPHGHHLHGRVLGRGPVLQREAPQEREGARLEREDAERELHGDFTSQTKGLTLTNTFIQEGADIIFPVAGNVGLGAAKAVQTADQPGPRRQHDGVDTDGCMSAAQYCKYFITSVEKGIQTAVKTAVLGAAHGTFKGGNYIGTLSNGGVGSRRTTTSPARSPPRSSRNWPR